MNDSVLTASTASTQHPEYLNWQLWFNRVAVKNKINTDEIGIISLRDINDISGRPLFLSHATSSTSQLSLLSQFVCLCLSVSVYISVCLCLLLSLSVCMSVSLPNAFWWSILIFLSHITTCLFSRGLTNWERFGKAHAERSAI